MDKFGTLTKFCQKRVGAKLGTWARKDYVFEGEWCGVPSVRGTEAVCVSIVGKAIGGLYYVSKVGHLQVLRDTIIFFK